VDPAGGSTASTAVTASAATTSIRPGARAPRRTASRPATTPPVPAAAAAHSATVTSGAGGCMANHHGGPAPALGTCTTALLGPAAETTIMISSDEPMPARASRLGTLAPAPAGATPAGGLPAPGDTWGTAVVTACSLMGHAPAWLDHRRDRSTPRTAVSRACGEDHHRRAGS